MEALADAKAAFLASIASFRALSAAALAAFLTIPPWACIEDILQDL